MLNDDYTSNDFVTEVLLRFFHKTVTEAIELTSKIHSDGKAVIDVYPYEVAESKVAMVGFAAKQAGYPFRTVMEEE
jgi:ATP-dependent Clp protease adaptor protein ClpS